MKKPKKSKKKLIIIIAIILVLFIAVRSCASNAKKKFEELNNKTQIDEVSRRDLLFSVGASGEIASIKSRNITVDIDKAEVKTLNVKVGDQVKKGSVLATFDVSETSRSLYDARKSLNNSNELNEQSIEDAKRALENAKNSKDNAIYNAKNNVNDKKYDYEQAKKTYSELKEKQKNNLATEVEVLQAEKYMEEAKLAYENAKDDYDETKDAQEDLVKKAESALKNIELSYDTSTQESQIRNYQTQIKNGTIKAPFDGTITSISYEVGDTYVNGSVFLTIQDCSAYEITAEILEYDISKISVGQNVIIKTDATGDLEMQGKVKEVSPVASTTINSNGVTTNNQTYSVKVSIDNPSDKLRLDMSASISIIIDKHDNVLTVPYSAIYTDPDNKTYVIKVDENNNQEHIYVDVVMESNYYVEITGNNIYEGMKVLSYKEETVNPFEVMMGGGGF